MCRAVRCATCNKTTWAGCGQHVDQVMAGVPARERCTCSAEQRAGGGSQRAGQGFLARLIGR